MRTPSLYLHCLCGKVLRREDSEGPVRCPKCGRTYLLSEGEKNLLKKYYAQMPDDATGPDLTGLIEYEKSRDSP